MANIKWLTQAVEDMKGLDNSIRTRVFKTIKKLEKNPEGYGIPLGHHNGKDLRNLFKIEPSDGYRIIYAILSNELVIITVVGKRADEKVYRTATDRMAAVRALVGKEIEIISQLTDELNS